MREISLKELLEAGCHFGHQVTRQNPKAREFIFQARQGIHVIDLAKTKEGLEQAAAFVKTTASRGGTIIFVGTKRQAKGIVEEQVLRLGSLRQISGQAGQAGVFLVTERWIGGTLTNFEEVYKNYAKLKDLRARLVNEEEKAKYTKKEVGLWNKERIKLEKLYGGVSDMEKLPDAVFIVDTHKEDLAVKEAARCGIPVIGIVDTNADPTVIDYPIPANDDAVGSLKLIIEYIAEAWMEGVKEREKLEEVEKVVKEEKATKGEENAKEKSKSEKPKAKKTSKKTIGSN